MNDLWDTATTMEFAVADLMELNDLMQVIEEQIQREMISGIGSNELIRSSALVVMSLLSIARNHLQGVADHQKEAAQHVYELSKKEYGTKNEEAA